MNVIKGEALSLHKFLQEYDFIIPPYQRPYSWENEQTSELFDDLYTFWSSNPGKDEQYFLGSIVLDTSEGGKRAKVIDGQQRLTTLTILFSVIASEFPANTPERRKADFYINAQAEGVEDGHRRLSIRTKDDNFFRKYIQAADIDALLALNVNAQDTDAKKNIIRNARLLRARIRDKFASQENIMDFLTCVVTKCSIVAISTPAHDTAFRVFSVINNRGMDLTPTDILKAEIIGQIIDHDEQEQYTKIWDNTENNVTRPKFQNLFSAIRMIYVKAKARKSLLDEFKASVLPNITDNAAKKFIDDVLVPYSRAYIFLKSSTSHNAYPYLKWLNTLENSDWLPPAMKYYVMHENDPDALGEFFRKLERLAAYLLVGNFYGNSRIPRYSQILSELEASNGSNFPSIELLEEEKQYFIRCLDSEVFHMSRPRQTYIILRLDSFVAASTGASYDHSYLTIEHVLPQTVNENTYWSEKWPDEDERAKWLHKLGNLIPLEGCINSSASNRDFTTKKDTYFFKKGATSYALASQIAACTEWTPEIVSERQRNILETFRKNWDL